jgi:hypothetical protein
VLILLSENGSVGDSLRKHGLGVGKKTTKKSYQKFFDGYVEYREPGKNGKEKHIMLYVSEYHVNNLPVGKKILVRFLYAALIVASIMLYINSANSYGSYNLTWYVAVPVAVACVLLTWLIISFVFFYIPCIGKLTHFEFKYSVQNLMNSSLASAAVIAAASAISMISILFHREASINNMMYSFEYLISALFMYLVYFIEKKMKYELVPSGNKAPVGSVYVATMEEVLPPKKKVKQGIGSEDLFDVESLPYEVDENKIIPESII